MVYLPMTNPSPTELRQQRAWVKAIGKRRLTAFEEALADPDLISLKQELVKIDLRIADLEERARKGESRGSWEHVANFAKAFGKALDEPLPDLGKLRDLTARLDACATQGEQDWATWDEVIKLIEVRRKLSATEQKYEEMRNYKMPYTEVIRLLDDLHGAIFAVVQDRLLRFQILDLVRKRCNGDAPNAKPRIPFELPTAYMLATPPIDEFAIITDAVDTE